MKQFKISIEMDTHSDWATPTIKKEVFKVLGKITGAFVTELNVEEIQTSQKKRYYLKHRFMRGFEEGTFLNFCRICKILCLDDKNPSWDRQTQFTQEEIDKLKSQYKTTLDDFEQIEVED